jgi:hypothetical protein
MKSNDGLAALKAEYLLMPKHVMQKMKPFWPQLESSAKEFDSIAAMALPESSGDHAVANVADRPAFNPARLASQQTEQKQAQQPEQIASQPIEQF